MNKNELFLAFNVGKTNLFNFHQRTEESRMMSFQPPELRFFHQNSGNDSDSKLCSSLENSSSTLTSTSAAESDRFLSTQKPKGETQQAVFNRDSNSSGIGQIPSQTRLVVVYVVVVVIVVVVVVDGYIVVVVVVFGFVVDDDVVVVVVVFGVAHLATFFSFSNSK